MAEESNFMNLDLNLGPVEISSNDDGERLHGSYPHITMSVEDFFDTAAAQLRGVAQLRNHRWRSLQRHLPVSPERQSLSLELISRNDMQIGEGSVAPDGRAIVEAKLCENCTSYAEDKDLGAKKDSEKNNVDEGSFFDCNICLDLAMDPVVTCCGHLFCWACIYRWLYHHSDVKRCPICKGGVTMKDVIPIYGRGSDKREPKLDSSLKIPPRPQACSTQGRRHISRSVSTFPMDEVIRQLEGTYDRQIAEIRVRSSDVIQERSPYPRVSIIRGMHREQPPVMPNDDLNDTGGLFRGSEPAHFATPDVALNLVGSNHRVHESREIRRPRSAGIRRAHAHRSALPSFLVDSYINLNPPERNQEPDRDSVSSIAAAIHSESQTVDNAVEIDSTVARSTLSSRRRSDASRISDVDSGDSPASRRRRLN